MNFEQDDTSYDIDDSDDDDEVECLRCPNCDALVYEEAQQCPACGDYIHFDTNVWKGRAWWWIGLALAGALATFYVLLFT